MCALCSPNHWYTDIFWKNCCQFFFKKKVDIYLRIWTYLLKMMTFFSKIGCFFFYKFGHSFYIIVSVSGSARPSVKTFWREIRRARAACWVRNNHHSVAPPFSCHFQSVILCPPVDLGPSQKTIFEKRPVSGG